MRFAVCCPYCGTWLDVIPVEGDDWHEAVAWGYLAAKRHEPDCPARKKAPVD